MKCGHLGTFFCHKCPDDPETAGPGIHALVIGTSDYRPRGKAAVVFDNLAGTAVAANKFAAWLVDGFHDPNLIPLRTVRVLLSPMPSEDAYLPQPDTSWDPATRENVRQALEDWADDCNSHHGNVAILYVGGHGTVTTDGAMHIFLSEANAHKDRYDSSINVSVVKTLMLNCHARSNIYVFDCCALSDGQIPDVTASGGVKIAPFTDNPGPQRKYEFTITAARVGTKSHALGAKNGTLLSWAMLPLLKTAGKLISGFFTVTKEKLDEQLLPTMGDWPNIKLPPGHEPVIKGDADPNGFTRPKPPPDFSVTLMSDPAAAGNIVTITISDEAGGAEKKRCQVNGGNSKAFQLQAGHYTVVSEYRTENGTKERSFKLDLDHSLRLLSYTGDLVP